MSDLELARACEASSGVTLQYTKTRAVYKLLAWYLSRRIPHGGWP